MIREPTTSKGLFGSDIDTWRILIERGLVIASLWPTSIEQPDTSMVLFRLDKTRYGILTDQVYQIKRLQEYTPLPFTQRCIVGVVHIQDRMVAVLDLCQSEQAARIVHRFDDTWLIIVTLHGMDVGLLADEIIAAPHTPWRS